MEFIYSGLLFSEGDIFREMLQPVFGKVADIHHLDVADADSMQCVETLWLR